MLRLGWTYARIPLFVFARLKTLYRRRTGSPVINDRPNFEERRYTRSSLSLSLGEQILKEWLIERIFSFFFSYCEFLFGNFTISLYDSWLKIDSNDILEGKNKVTSMISKLKCCYANKFFPFLFQIQDFIA